MEDVHGLLFNIRPLLRLEDRFRVRDDAARPPVGDVDALLRPAPQKLDEVGPGKRVLTFNYDTGERYLSVPDFLPEE